VFMYLGGCGEPVMFMSAPMVVYWQTCDDVGSGENENVKWASCGIRAEVK
jgi:hypothetical protein